MLDRTRPDWPPNYDEKFKWRAKALESIRKDPSALEKAKLYYATHRVEFINDWCDTYDPRNAGIDGKLVRMPFVTFPRQDDYIHWLESCLKAEGPGLNEKSRDMGATWLCIAFSVHALFFMHGATIGWGSRKAGAVDRIGDMSSIFEKMRYLIRSIPPDFWPPGFSDDCMHYMKIYSPLTEASITGESGDDIGRGGRTMMYFKDESAHYEHPEAIEAALSDTTRVPIDLSSVNGLGNVFHRKRESGVEWEPGQKARRDKVNVFVMDWRDHPDKSQVWYDERKQKAEDEGLLHIFYQEIDRNYAASVEGVLVPSAWFISATDVHLPNSSRAFYRDGIPDMEFKFNCAGQDVADEGGDTNAYARRRGVVLKYVREWGAPDVGETTRICIEESKDHTPIEIQYDCIGVGAGVKSEANRLAEMDLMPKRVKLIAWNAGLKGKSLVNAEERYEPDDNESSLNCDFYENLKAQAGWNLRRRFEKVHNMVTKGVEYPPEELISIDRAALGQAMYHKLQKEISQPTTKLSATMKLMVNKRPDGTKSPNCNDAVVMCFFPITDNKAYDRSLSWVSGKFV